MVLVEATAPEELGTEEGVGANSGWGVGGPPLLGVEEDPMDDYGMMGSRVRFNAVLTVQYDAVEGEMGAELRTWVRTLVRTPVRTPAPADQFGWIVGVRWLREGIYYPSDGWSPAHLKITRTIKAYLVAKSPYVNAVPVLPEDVAPAGEEKG